MEEIDDRPEMTQSNNGQSNYAYQKSDEDT